MLSHQPSRTNEQPILPGAAQSTNLLVLPPATPGTENAAHGPRHIVPQEHLEPGDAIEVLGQAASVSSSWHTPVASVVTLITTSQGAQLNVVTRLGMQRTIDLDQFQAVTLWPGAAYQIVSTGGGDVIRMQRDFRAAHAHKRQEPPPTSGYSIYTASRENTPDAVVDILPATAVPGFEVKLVEGFTENKPHYHQTFDEAYYNVAGALRVKLTPHNTGASQTLDVPAGGCVIIPRYTDHHVLAGSDDNKILVFYWPRFNGQPGNDWHPA